MKGSGTRAVAAIISISCFTGTTAAFAADHFQIIPLGSSGIMTSQKHAALVIDTESGDAFQCQGDWTGPTPPSVTCRKIKIDSGSPGKGPAELYANINLKQGGYTAIWKVNQTTGDVTFCNASTSDFPPTHWSCGTGRLPE
jgi:hypothetical protein